MPGILNQKPSTEEMALVISKAKKLIESVGVDTYSKVDIEKLQQAEIVEQFWLHTYYLSGNQVDETVDMIEKTFRWRKEFGANEIRKESLNQKLVDGPMFVREEKDKDGYKVLVFCLRKEFGANEIRKESLNQKLVNGPMFVREEKDKDGYKVLVFCLRKHVKVADEVEEMKKVFVSFLEEMRQDDVTQRVTLVFDCSGAGLKNVDMDLVKFLVNMQNYYPNMLAKILIYDLPWILNPVLTVIKALLPGPAAKMMRMTNKTTVGDHLTDASWLVA